MKSYQDRYNQFLNTHKNAICSELSIAFDRMIHHFSRDFGGNVVIPLFIIWAVVMFMLPRPVSKFNIFAISSLFVFFSFWTYSYIDKLILKIGSYYFNKYEYKSLIIKYVNLCELGTLNKCETDGEADDVKCFFEFCRKEIVDEHFLYQ